MKNFEFELSQDSKVSKLSNAFRNMKNFYFNFGSIEELESSKSNAFRCMKNLNSGILHEKLNTTFCWVCLLNDDSKLVPVSIRNTEMRSFWARTAKCLNCQMLFGTWKTFISTLAVVSSLWAFISFCIFYFEHFAFTTLHLACVVMQGRMFLCRFRDRRDFAEFVLRPMQRTTSIVSWVCLL